MKIRDIIDLFTEDYEMEIYDCNRGVAVYKGLSADVPKDLIDSVAGSIDNPQWGAEHILTVNI